MDPLEGESWSFVVLFASRKSQPDARLRRYREAERTFCSDVRAHPGRRLTRLTFEQRRNIDARYRSPLHFLELWSITAALSCLVLVHDYRPLAAADRDNLLSVYLLRKRSAHFEQWYHFCLFSRIQLSWYVYTILYICKEWFRLKWVWCRRTRWLVGFINEMLGYFGSIRGGFTRFVHMKCNFFLCLIRIIVIFVWFDTFF